MVAIQRTELATLVEVSGVGLAVVTLLLQRYQLKSTGE